MKRVFLAVDCLVVAALAAACGSSTPATAPTETARAIATATTTAGATAAPTRDASPTIPSGTVTVQLAEHFFSPSLITVKVGTTVVWVDVGQQQHDVHARDSSFNSPPMGPGDTFKFTFTKAGKFPYYCVPHEGDGMIGEVDVVD